MSKYELLCLLLTLVLLPSLSSCFDLEEELYDRLEEDDYYTDYESLMASVLRPYEQAKETETYYYFWLQEISADQLVITEKQEHWEDSGKWRMLHQHAWDTYEDNCDQMWSTMYTGIGYCNNVLEDIADLDYTEFDLEETDKNQHIAELKALRAYFQLQLFDAFHTPPISITTDEEVGSATALENFEFIEESFLEALPYLPQGPLNNYEGRITQAAVAQLLMRLYFNASWYIDQPMWEETRDLCEDILAGVYGDYSLTSDWTDLWNVGNGDCPEIIWSYPQSKQVAYDEFYWWFFMHYNSPEQFGNSGDYSTPYNGCHLSPTYDPTGKPYTYTLGCTFSKYPDTDIRKKHFKVTDQGQYEGLFLYGPQTIYDSDEYVTGAEEWGDYPLIFVDQVAHYCEELTTDAEKQTIVDLLLAADTSWVIHGDRFASLASNVRTGEENTGIRIVKYPFYPSGDDAIKANDLVVLRLTEVYYTLAEVSYRLGDAAKAEALLNQVRQRYYSAEDWEAVKYPEDGSALNDQELLDEWGREFLAEKRRRTDLNRFGIFTSAEWWDKEPSEDYRRFFPIPASAISNNPLLEPSEGYTY